jgi:beta-galactosidase
VGLWAAQHVHAATVGKGAGLNDEYSQPFGFREFWIEGNQFYLNNTLFHIRPATVQNAKKRMESGFNLMEIWPSDHTRRGSNHNDDEIIAEADKVGMPLAGNLTHMAEGHQPEQLGQA